MGVDMISHSKVIVIKLLNLLLLGFYNISCLEAIIKNIGKTFLIVLIHILTYFLCNFLFVNISFKILMINDNHHVIH